MEFLNFRVRTVNESLFLQVRTALMNEAKKAGVIDAPDSLFSFLVEKVRNNLHIILCMSPVGDPFR